MTIALLVAEDDPDVAGVVAFGARMVWPGCDVTVAPDGATALRLFTRGRPDLVVLDVSMPPPDGFEVCRRIRDISTVPILMLTARDSTLDKVRALDLGADDYLTKPFDHLELLARLRALVRRARIAPALAHEPAPLTALTPAPAASTYVEAGDVVLDTATREARVGGRVVRLTSTEYRLLEELVRQAGRVLPYRYLLQRVWGSEYVDEVHYLRVFVRRLRQKLGDDPAHPRYIQTDWHTGYRFAPTPD